MQAHGSRRSARLAGSISAPPPPAAGPTAAGGASRAGRAGVGVRGQQPADQRREEDERDAANELDPKAAEQARLGALVGDRGVTLVEPLRDVDDQADRDHRKADGRQPPSGPAVAAGAEEDSDERGQRQRQARPRVRAAGALGLALHLGRRRDRVDADVVGRADRDAPVVGELGGGERDRRRGRDEEGGTQRRHLALGQVEEAHRLAPEHLEDRQDESPGRKGCGAGVLGRPHVQPGRNPQHLADDRDQLGADPSDRLRKAPGRARIRPLERLRTRLSQRHLGLLAGFMPLL